MAVSTNENGIKILANNDGLRLLRTFENLAYDASQAEAATKVVYICICIYLCLLNINLNLEGTMT